MDFIPGFRMPYFMGNRYIENTYGINNMKNRNIGVNAVEKRNQNQYINEKQEYNRQTSSKKAQEEKEERNFTESEKPVFEIFGIKLYFDDILIISLILFLYNEGVRDNLLFISLILILMS